MTSDDRRGWDWFGPTQPSVPTAAAEQFQDCFKSLTGRAVLRHLRQHFIERRLSASASSDELRHLEGARCAIAYIERLAALSSTNSKERADD